MKNRIKKFKSNRNVIFWDTTNTHCSDIDQEIAEMLDSYQQNVWEEISNTLKSMTIEQFDAWKRTEEFKSSEDYC